MKARHEGHSGVKAGMLAKALAMLWMALMLPNAAWAQSRPDSGPYLVIDAATGDVLAQERAGETWYPASLTKLMTAYVVFQKIREGKLRLDQDIVVTPEAAAQEPSKIGIPAGKTVSVDFALQALLVYSANDMAYVLAAAASGDHHRFAAEMNRVARSLGLSATHFANPNGLYDPRQVTSPRDIGILAAIMLNEFPEHAHYFSQDALKVGKRRLANRNALIRMMPEADGMKTGFVCNSGYNLVASATRDGRRLIAVVMGARSGYGRAVVAKDLLEKNFAAPSKGNHLKVAEIVNLPQGAIVPADLTRSVCRSKTPVQLAGADGLQGWAISFGTYEDMIRADMALRGRLLSPIGIDTMSSAGIVELPEKAGYAALMWNITQEQSLSLCTAYRADQAHCDVMPPALVEQIAAHLRAKEPPPKPVAQGADDEPDDAAAPVPAKPAKKKPARKKKKQKKQ